MPVPLAEAIRRWKSEVLGNPLARNLMEGDIVAHLDHHDASVVVDGYSYSAHAGRLRCRRVLDGSANLEASP